MKYQGNNAVEKLVKLAKQLPPDYTERDGKVLKRTIWTEFAASVQQDKLDVGSFCARAIAGLAAEVFEQLSYPEKMNLARKLSGKESFAQKGVKALFGETIEFAAHSPRQNPYRRVRALENLKQVEEVVTGDWQKQWPWLSTDGSGRIQESVGPKDDCRSLCKKILVSKALPPLIEKAIGLAETSADFDEVVYFVRECGRSDKFLKAQRDMQDMQDEYNAADPALYFSFARKPILAEDQANPFVEKMFGILNEKCPNREGPIAELLLCVVRRLLGDQDAVYPLLWGPPGTAKTFVLEQLCDAFNEAGIRTNYVLQAMTQSGGYSRRNNEVAMSLQGTSSKWGSGRSGILYAKTFREDTQLTLVALDEVDKCALQDYLVSLLDPRQPLQDSYWRELVSSIDMRSKVLFFGTANDVEVIRQGGQSPIWSRIKPIEMDGYSFEESIELVTRLVSQRALLGGQTLEVEIKKIAVQVVNKYRGRTLPSIRALIDQVNHQLYVKQFPVLEKALAEECQEYRPSRGMGFYVG